MLRLKLKLQRLVGKVKYKIHMLISKMMRKIAHRTTKISQESYQKAFNIQAKIGKKHVK